MKKGVFDGFMVIVPTNRWAREIRRLLLERSREKVVSAPLIFGFNRAIELLYSRLHDNSLCEIPQAERLLLIYSISQNVLSDLPDKNHPLFRIPLERLTGVVDTTIQKIKKEGYTPESFSSALRIDPVETPDLKLLFLLRCFTSYEERLRNYGCIDFSGKVMEVCRLVNEESENLASAFPRLDYLAVFGFDMYSRTMYDLLERLSSALNLTTVVLESDQTRPWVFEHLSEPEQIISDFADEVFVHQGKSADLPLEKISRDFFRQPRDVSPDAQVKESCIGIIEGKDPSDEVDKICRWIKDLVLCNPDTDLEKICLCFPNLEDYIPIIHRSFLSYGIPFSFSMKPGLLESLYSHTVLSLVDMVASNYERPAMLQFFRSPYIGTFGDIDPQNVVSIDSGLLNDLANQYGIVDGKESWLEALTMEAQILTRLAGGEEGVSEQESELDYPALSPQRAKKRLDLLRDIEGKLRILFDKLSQFEQPQTLEYLSRKIRNLVEEFGFEQAVLDYWENEIKNPGGPNIPSDIIAREYLALDGVQNAFALLEESSHFFSSDATFSIQELNRLLEPVMDSITLNIPTKGSRGVQILGKLEPRGVSFDYIIFGGLNEGRFPRPLKPDPFLSEERRNKLHFVPKGEHVLSKDLFIFYSLLRQAGKKFICTYPGSADDKLLLPSLVIEELKQITTCEVIVLKPETDFFTLKGIHTHLSRKIRSHVLNSESEKMIPSIDDVELTLLPDDVTSQARAGVTLNLTRNLLHSVSEYEGFLKDEKNIACLKRYGAEAISVSQMEQYGRCPFEFFCSRILGIEELPEFEDEMSPLDRGKLVHRILYRFYSRMKEEGRIPIDTDKKMAESFDTISAIAQTETVKFSYKGIFWEIEKENLFGNPEKKIKGLLKVFLELERRRYDSPAAAEFVPAFFEVSFGGLPFSSATDTISRKEPLLLTSDDITLRIRGRIDRVDLSKDAFIVFDYKTSTQKPTLKDLEKGQSMQLPVYLLACEELLHSHTGKKFKMLGSLYYMVRNEADCKIENFLSLKGEDTDEDKKTIIKEIIGRNVRAGFYDDLDAWLDQAKQHMINHIRGIRGGLFSPGERDVFRMCGHCPFRRICSAVLSARKLTGNQP